MPVVALVDGAAFGGAVGLVACCDYALASTTARFCLSEVRIGLVPALILPYLLHKVPRTFLVRAGLTGEVFSAEEAQQQGLITKVIPCDDFKKELPAEINALLQCAPQAQASFKKLLADIRPATLWQARKCRHRLPCRGTSIGRSEGRHCRFLCQARPALATTTR